MDTIQATALFHQPVERVFALAFDPQKMLQWQPDVRSMESTPLPPEPGGPARSRVKARSKIGPALEVVEEVTEFVPNQRRTARLREVHGWLTAQSQWRFEPAADGTQVTVQHDMEMHGWMRWVKPLFLFAARRKIEGDLLRLKDLSEKG